MRTFAIVGAAWLVLTLGGCAAPSGTASQPPADSQTADAIQQVIQQSNSEQAQAVASRDPSVISDTATDSYYRSLQQTYRDLVSQDAVSIELTNLTWGAITASGSNGTANTVETWSTTFSDGTTDQSTDPNVYTLVDRGGTWLIQDDRQPTTASPAQQVTPGPASQSPTPVPTLSADGQDTSRNWSGYAASGGSYTGISTWTVPQVVSAVNGASGVGASSRW